eukprot:TRINITY_DN3531_c0_g1_i2.p2 TRINITY_DN3531_c0_g1~~TRINITY_DN3531_c0_g1_i2.p2  ORF type:complete len:128 (-),score=16.27 TRINITY_DN3531_c0_g1_i2:420-803(-)
MKPTNIAPKNNKAFMLIGSTKLLRIVANVSADTRALRVVVVTRCGKEENKINKAEFYQQDRPTTVGSRFMQLSQAVQAAWSAGGRCSSGEQWLFMYWVAQLLISARISWEYSTTFRSTSLRTVSTTW